MALANETGINFINFILIFVGNCLQLMLYIDFSVWMRTGFNLVVLKPIGKAFDCKAFDF